MLVCLLACHPSCSPHVSFSFQTQNVVPDIVTVRGEAFAAVVTTREIAASFPTDLPSTFGGNPVSCSAGLALLDVLEREKLQENARIVGDRLLNKLSRLMRIHQNIGDVRGLGLSLGIEFIRDHLSLAPFPELATAATQRLADSHSLLVTIVGIFKNVIKIKPPLCFTASNADQLVQTLDEVLTLLEKTPLVTSLNSLPRENQKSITEPKQPPSPFASFLAKL